MIADLKISESLYSLVDSTTPGESSNTIFLSNNTSYIVFVTPGVFPVAAAFYLFNELINDDFPTFGNPITPTTIYCLALLLPSTLA